MRRVLAAAAATLTLAGAATAPAAAAAPATAPHATALNVYTATLTPAQADKVRAAGLDDESLSLTRRADGSYTAETVLSPDELQKLTKLGLPMAVKKIHGKTAAALLREKNIAGWKSFRSYSEPGGIRDEIAATAARYPDLAKVETIGYSTNGQPILALKVTRNARKTKDGSRPAVLYAGTQHAREWITTEMNRRLMHHVLDNYASNAEIAGIVNSTELWFVPVVNPDGYDYTFTPDNRLWRKTLRDNNADGKITAVDGVDPNRNYPTKWGYDNEGSSPSPASETYRGPGPASEPETRALDKLFGRVHYNFFINYHSAAELLLYGTGWQVNTPSPDDVISKALAGDPTHSAVPGYRPELSAELYTTNGETTEHMQSKYNTLGFTPEMSTCETVSDWYPDDPWKKEDCVSIFVFPDDENLISREFRNNLPFALSVAKSAKDPAHPVSSLGLTTPDLVPHTFPTSYGKSQPVSATVRKSLVDVKLAYTINGGKQKVVGTSQWKGGERFGASNTAYFAERRGTVTGTKAGDKVDVWFTAKYAKTDKKPFASTHFSYRVNPTIGGNVLVLAMEDVTGASPTQTGTTAKYASQYAAAAKAAGYRPDVYDFDAQGRRAPDALGVLSHYRAVIWETGDDQILRNVGQPAGTAARAAEDTEMAVRAYLNEGGKVIVAGQNALLAQASGSYSYDPSGDPECTTPGKLPCLALSNDFLQYYLGAYSYLNDGGKASDTEMYPLVGTAGAFNGFAGALNADGSAKNQTHSATFLPTSGFLPPKTFPQFTSAAQVDWKRPGPGPYAPYDGSWYLRSGDAAQSYQRLSKTVDLTAAKTADLNLWMSYDTEQDWDYVFVEAHEVGTDNWTTLPDRNGHTGTAAGESCAAGIADRLHPQLKHYFDKDCKPTGTTGSWNAVSGSSGGWQNWSLDLSGYAGKKVELAIVAATDWGTQGLGVFVDQVKVTADGVAAGTSFETDLGGWTVPGPPAGSPGNTADWVRGQRAFVEGAVVTTPDSVLAGFGLEGFTATTRNDFVSRALTQLKVAKK